MQTKRPMIDIDGEVRELTAKEIASLLPFSALPEEEQAVLIALRESATVTAKSVDHGPRDQDRQRRFTSS